MLYVHTQQNHCGTFQYQRKMDKDQLQDFMAYGLLIRAQWFKFLCILSQFRAKSRIEDDSFFVPVWISWIWYFQQNMKNVTFSLQLKAIWCPKKLIENPEKSENPEPV